MTFDFKKEYPEFYLPPKASGIIEVPSMNFLVVRGKGDPNEEAGEYGKALELLYGMAYTIKMGYKAYLQFSGSNRSLKQNPSVSRLAIAP